MQGQRVLWGFGIGGAALLIFYALRATEPEPTSRPDDRNTGESPAVQPAWPTAASDVHTLNDSNISAIRRPSPHVAAGTLLDQGAHPQQENWSDERDRIAQKRRKLLRHDTAPHTDPQGAMDFFMEQRLPDGETEYPMEKLQRALGRIREREQAAEADREASSVFSWTELGPGNVGGRTRAIVIDPTNPNVMYAAGVSGGVWKSMDAGASWNVTDDVMLNLAVSTLVMDPTDPDILYAGTGEGYRGYPGGSMQRGLGIFKSVDGGASWAQLSGTVSGVPTGAFYFVNRLVISPANPNRLYAGTQYGVWKSVDGGASWSVVLRNPDYLSGAEPASNGSTIGCLDLDIRTDTAPGADVLLASFGSYAPDGLFRSTDSGATWTQVGTTGDLIVPNQGRMEIAVAPSDNDVMYVSMASNGQAVCQSGPLTGSACSEDAHCGTGGICDLFRARRGSMVDVFQSLDGGATWSSRLDFSNPTSIVLLSNTPFMNGCFGVFNLAQGWYDNIIAVDPVDPDTVWVGGIDLFRSVDGGANFDYVSYWYFSPFSVNYVHADHHALVFHPDYDGTTNQVLYSGSDGGLARTDNARAAASTNGCPAGGDITPLPEITWTGLNNGYGVTQFYQGDSASSEETYAGGTQDNGTPLVNSASTPDDWRQVIGGDGGYFAIDPTNNLVMYGETQRFPSILKSVDGGESFSDATDGITDSDGLFITPVAMDPSDPNILWSGGTRPWRTTDGAASWTLAATGFADAGTISAIAIAPTDSETVYLGFSNGVVAKTTDGVSGLPEPSWVEYTSVNGLNEAFISSIAVSPVDANTAYCTYSTFGVSHILKTTDGGNTWSSIDSLAATGVPDIPVHWIVIRACAPDELYVGTELGVFQSLDDGATWTPTNAGIPNAIVESLDFQSDFHLVAFTHGRGAFRARLNCPCDTGVPITDCDGNGIHDECDILDGTYSDCNGNEVPDTCEVPPLCPGCADCNTNGVPDECERDCQSNGVPDDCDIDVSDPDGNGTVSADCNVDLVPDECEDDCQPNGIPDDCDIDTADPDGDGLVSNDCNADGFPDECDVLGGGTLFDVDFEFGLPAGWSISGVFTLTGQCEVTPVCDGARWAYAGQTSSCSYGDRQFGELVSPSVTLGTTYSELRFCSLVDTELGFDFADVLVNDEVVFRDSGAGDAWEEHVIDLTPYNGQTITITFRFDSDGGVSGTLGWQVDRIQLVSGSADCNGNEIPDECDVAPGGGYEDVNGDGVPDVCDNQPALPAPPPHNRRKNRYVSFDPNPANTGSSVAFKVLLDNGTGTDIPLGWVGIQDPEDPSGVFRIVADKRLSASWPSPVHVADCEVAPDRTYKIVTEGATGNQAGALAVRTAEAPGPSVYWADCTGPFSFYCSESYGCCDPNPDCPGTACPAGESCEQQWPPPDGATNFIDVQAAIRKFQEIGQVPDATWVDLHGAEGPAGDPYFDPPNGVVNFADVQQIIKGFQGDEYPYSDPTGCP